MRRAGSSLTSREESAEAAKALEDEGKARQEDTVPDELKLGYREDIEKESGKPQDDNTEASGAPKSGATADEGAGDTEAELAEGFVQTAPLIPVEATTFMPPPQWQPPQYAAAQPGQAMPQNNVWPQHQIHHIQPIRPDWSNEGVPAWVDRAILGVVAALVVMLLKLVLEL
ncbi:hypothetical protein V491_02445 [Pseudogymnoascus sp. VKM F-3775]|nr:hypothetical protein V491_02445 [Pseudogymnoascus sp. VKM F-3775]